MYYLKKLGYSRWGGGWMILGVSNRTKFSPRTPKKENLFCLDLFFSLPFREIISWLNTIHLYVTVYFKNRKNLCQSFCDLLDLFRSSFFDEMSSSE